VTDAELKRAQDAIDQDEPVIYDVAGNVGQMVDNVKHMRWFRRAVAEWLTADAEVIS
jgi:hypothetical protein